MEAVAGEQPILEILNLLREAATATLTSHEHTAGVNGIASAAAPAEMGAGAGAGPSSSSAGTLLSMAGVLTGTAITLAKAGIIPVPWGRRKRADEDEDPDMVLGKKLIELKRYADAIQAFDRVVARNPRHKNAYNNRAVAYFFEGMYETCVHDCDAQIEVDPKGSLEAWSNKALALEKLDENVDALDAWTRALEIASSLGSVSPHLYVQRAQLQIKLGENGDAYDDFCRALELDGEDPDAHAGKADALLRSGDNLDEALACVQEAVSLAPDCSENYAILGRAYTSSQQPDAHRLARDAFTRAIELDSDNSGAYYNRAYIQEKEGRFDEALADYAKAVETDKKCLMAYIQRANIISTNAADISANMHAVKEVNKAIECDDKHWLAYTTRGTILQRMKRYKDAIKDFTKALNILHEEDEENSPEYAMVYSKLDNCRKLAH